MTSDLIATVARSLNGSTQHHREKLVAEIIAAIDSSGTHRVAPITPPVGVLRHAARNTAVMDPEADIQLDAGEVFAAWRCVLDALPKQEATSDE